MIDITFLGGMYPPNEAHQYYACSKQSSQAAADITQWRFVEGLEKNFGKSLNLISFPFIGSYPLRFKKPFVKNENFTHSRSSRDRLVGFCNVMWIKQILLPLKMKKIMGAWAAKQKNKDGVVLIGYSAEMAKTLVHVKKVAPNVVTLLIVPDLPEFTSLGRKGFLFAQLKKRKAECFRRIVERKGIDKYVFLTKQMAERLNVDSSDYVVVEGMTDERPQLTNDDSSLTRHSEKIVLYTGGINLQYGVGDLIDEFKKIDNPNFRLVLCGGGPDTSAVKTACFSDKRITFLGLVPPDEAAHLRAQADVLVNPRKNIGDFTAFSFPSKTMEYLSAYKPVVCFKLDGIPSEYDDVLIYAKEKSGGLATALEYAASLDYSEQSILIKKTKALLAIKTPSAQCQKIKYMLEAAYDSLS